MATVRTEMARRRLRGPDRGPAGAAPLELDDRRIAAIDAAGIDVSVRSLTTPGLQDLGADDAVRLQTQVNDLLAETARGRPHRFQALARLRQFRRWTLPGV